MDKELAIDLIKELFEYHPEEGDSREWYKSTLRYLGNVITEECEEKSCDNCSNKKYHDMLQTKHGNTAQCCMHCKYAQDLVDKWDGR